MKFFFAEMVEAIHIEVSKELTGEIADRKAALSRERREEIVTGEMNVSGFLGIAGIN